MRGSFNPTNKDIFIELKSIGTRLGRIEERLDSHDRILTNIENKLGEHDQELSNINSKLDSHDQMFAHIYKELTCINTQLSDLTDAVIHNQNLFEQQIFNHETRITALETTSVL